MDEALRTRIDNHVKSQDVVLFLKGTRTAPQCGFSATVVSILDSLISDYADVNVLADDSIRQGIKDYSDWPTIPQLYVKGEFIGGCDIIKDMYDSGQLEEALGVTLEEIEPPALTISETAAQALGQALAKDDEFIRLEVDAKYNHGLSVGGRGGKDVEVQVGDLTVLLDRASAKRAEGVSIDYVETPSGPAFKIDNPNEPPKVGVISVHDLKAAMDAGPIELFDARTDKERELAKIEGARLLDRETQKHIMELPKDTPLYFHCHHGPRSGQAAEFFLSHGFTKVFNVAGGIDAWSQEIDPSVPRY